MTSLEFLPNILGRIDRTADVDYAELVPDRSKRPPKPAAPNEPSLSDA